MDIQGRSAALEKKALEISAYLKEQDKIKMANTWAEIQSKAPEIASLITEFSAAFGKPTAIRVDIAGNELLNNGVFIHETENKAWNGRLRPAKDQGRRW